MSMSLQYPLTTPGKEVVCEGYAGLFLFPGVFYMVCELSN